MLPGPPLGSGSGYSARTAPTPRSLTPQHRDSLHLPWCPQVPAGPGGPSLPPVPRGDRRHPAASLACSHSVHHSPTFRLFAARWMVYMKTEKPSVSFPPQDPEPSPSWAPAGLQGLFCLVLGVEDQRAASSQSPPLLAASCPLCVLCGRHEASLGPFRWTHPTSQHCCFAGVQPPAPSEWPLQPVSTLSD